MIETIAYIERLEKDDMRQNTKTGHLRRVTLYTIKTKAGDVLCEKATSAECAGKLGYGSINGFLRMVKQPDAADSLGLVITSEMGIIGGDVLPMQKAAPKYLYTASDAKGRVIMSKVIIDDLAVHYGLTRNGMLSALRQNGMVQNGFVNFRGDRIVRDYAKPEVKNKRRANDAL